MTVEERNGDLETAKGSGKSNKNKWLFPIGFLICGLFVVTTIMLSVLFSACMKNRAHQVSNLDPALPTFTPVEAYLGSYSTAAVAADSGLCSEIGRNIMLRGGNAVDSMIATVFCIGAVVPQSAGIGGSALMTIYNSTTKTCLAIDGRDRAPLAAKAEIYAKNPEMTHKGWLAIGVPGAIHSLYTAYKLAGSGKIDWKDLVTPSADLCRHGFPVSKALASSIQIRSDNLLKIDSFKEILINNKTGRLYQEGETMYRPVLASTLYRLAYADDPIKLFYNSHMTEVMVKEFKENGGIITMEDFQQYESKYGDKRPAITLKIGSDLVVCGPPPPSSAAVTMAILNIMQGFNITPSKVQKFHFQADIYHKLLESMKFAFATRMDLGDIDFVKTALESAQNITSAEYADKIRAEIMDQAQDVDYYQHESKFVPDDHGTSHVSVLDKDGNAASCTSTINFYFGAGAVSESTGILWNDEMDDFSIPGVTNVFSLDPSAANEITPGKRPLSSMSPLIVFNSTSGDPKIVVGSAGGSRIISAVAQVIMRLLWFGQNLKEAVQWPRLHNQLRPFQSYYEAGFPQAYLDWLTECGQNLTILTTFIPAATTIYRDEDGRIFAISDHRKSGGYPSGY